MMAQRVVALLLVFAASAACDAEPEPAAAVEASKPAAPVEAPVEPAPAPFKAADPEPPPAPQGTVALKAETWLYVQTCVDPHPCKDLLQPAGEEYCRAMKLGDRDGWRLPSRKEAEAFAGVDGLDALGGYHWTRTPYEEDANQVWIVDPAGAQPTTIPRDRKPFRVRCVNEA
jgi:hypothetical protein